MPTPTSQQLEEILAELTATQTGWVSSTADNIPATSSTMTLSEYNAISEQLLAAGPPPAYVIEEDEPEPEYEDFEDWEAEDDFNEEEPFFHPAIGIHDESERAEIGDTVYWRTWGNGPGAMPDDWGVLVSVDRINNLCALEHPDGQVRTWSWGSGDGKQWKVWQKGSRKARGFGAFIRKIEEN